MALAGCAVEPDGPPPYGYAALPYDAPGAPAYWPGPYSYPYGYAGSTLGFGFGGETWHEHDRDWHDGDWHREGGEGRHGEQRPSERPASAPPSHPAPAHPAAPARPSERPLPNIHSTPF